MELSGVLIFVLRPDNVFGPLYVATLLLGLAILVFTGVLRRYPPATWAGIVAGIFVLFVTGIKLFTYSPGEIWQIVSGTYTGVTHIKSIAAGMLMVALGFPLMKLWLSFRRPVFDDIVIFLPLLQILQRFGCFFSGCCQGTTTHLPWAVQYSEPSDVFYTHYDQGLLQVGQLHSAGVHPTQLYDIVLSLVIMAVLIAARRRFVRAGSFTMFALLLMGALGFFLQFLRVPLPGSWSDTVWMHLNLLQWAILLVASVVGIVLYRREKLLPVQQALPRPVVDNPGRSSFLLLMLLMLVWQVREIFEPLELLLLLTVAITGIVVAAIGFLHSDTTPASRMVMGSLLVAAFFTMGQTADQEGWFSFGVSGSAGAYEDINRDCGGNVTSRDKRDYSTFGTSLAYHHMYRPGRFTEVGIKQSYIYSPLDRSSSPNDHTLLITPYAGFDSPYFAGSLGIVFLNDWGGDNKNNYIYPMIYLRVGARDMLSFDFDWLNRTHFLGLSSIWQLGLNIGIGNNGYNIIRMGITETANIGIFNSPRSMGFYIGTELLIKDTWSLSPYFVMNKYPGFGVNMKYHLGQNRWKPATDR